MKKKLIIISIVIFGLSISTTHASCSSFEDFEETLYDSYDMIFVGKEIKNRPITNQNKKNSLQYSFEKDTAIEVEIIDLIKGTGGNSIIIETNNYTSCGFSLGEGNTGFIYLSAPNNKGIYSAGCCNIASSDRGTHLFSIAQEQKNRSYIEKQIHYIRKHTEYERNRIYSRIIGYTNKIINYF